jgi:hypothetical protein
MRCALRGRAGNSRSSDTAANMAMNTCERGVGDPGGSHGSDRAWLSSELESRLASSTCELAFMREGALFQPPGSVRLDPVRLGRVTNGLEGALRR